MAGPGSPTYVAYQLLFDAWHQIPLACASRRPWRPNLMDLIDGTRTFIVAPCRTSRSLARPALGDHPQQLVARTTGRAEVSKSGPRPRPGGTQTQTHPGLCSISGQPCRPRTPFLAGRWWSNPVTVALCGKSWTESPGSDRPGQHSGWYRSTALGRDHA